MRDYPGTGSIGHDLVNCSPFFDRQSVVGFRRSGYAACPICHQILQYIYSVVGGVLRVTCESAQPLSGFSNGISVIGQLPTSVLPARTLKSMSGSGSIWS